MARQTPNPSVTTRARTNNTQWMTLVSYLVVAALAFGFTLWSILDPDRTPYSFLNGIVLTAAACLSVFAYLAVFKDALHLFHSESDWKPSWPRYFAFGFGVPLVCYVLVVSTDVVTRATPLVLVSSLVFSTAAMAAAYLYRRHRLVEQSSGGSESVTPER